MTGPWRRAPAEAALFWSLVSLLAAIAILPTGRLLMAALLPAGVPGLSVVARVFAAPATWIAAGHTAVVSLAGMLISGLLGGGFALVAGVSDIGRKRALSFLFVLLMMVPSQVTAVAWIELVGPSSPLLLALGMAPAAGSMNPLYGPGGISLLLGIEHAPLVFLATLSGLRGLPADLVEAGFAAGARTCRVLRTIVMPLAAPAFLAGLALAFVSNIGNFGTPALLGIPGRYPVLTTLIYQRLAGFGPRVLGDVAALSLLLIVFALVGIGLEAGLARRRDVRLEGAAAAGPTIRLGRWRGVAEAVCWAMLALILAMPLTALAGTALVRAYGLPLSPDTATLDNFRYVLLESAASRRALANSFGLAAVAGLLLSAAAIPAAYFAVWRGSPLLRRILTAAELPYAMPGVVLAIACILLFVRPIAGIALYNTRGIILVAYLARFMTLAQKPVAAAFRQLDPRLEEAARMAGAGFPRRLVTIVIPLVLPAAAAGFLIVFLIAFNELTVSALLWSAGHETMGVVVFSLEQAGDDTLAAAVSTVSVLVTVALMAAATMLARRLPKGVLPWAA